VEDDDEFDEQTAEGIRRSLVSVASERKVLLCACPTLPSPDMY